MPTVHLPRSFMEFTGGLDEITVDAPRVHELLTALSERYPETAELIETMAVSIDGEIYSDPGYQPLKSDSDVHLIPRIAGG
jgi:molybdopterin converting factor small subunit